MRHCVEDDVDSEGIRAFLGKLAEKVLIFLFPLPTVTVVCIVAGDDHDSPLGIQERANVYVFALFSVVVLPGYAGGLAVLTRPEIWRLERILRFPQVKDAMK